jgi:C-6 monooxygenase
MADEQSFFSIIDYAVDGARTQRELIDAFAEIQQQWVSFHEGYRGARLFASVDGRRVYNLIEWASRADFERFEQTSDTAGRVAALEAAIAGVSGTAVSQMTGPPRFVEARVVAPNPRDREAGA